MCAKQHYYKRKQKGSQQNFRPDNVEPDAFTGLAADNWKLADPDCPSNGTNRPLGRILFKALDKRESNKNQELDRNKGMIVLL